MKIGATVEPAGIETVTGTGDRVCAYAQRPAGNLEASFVLRWPTSVDAGNL